uniref:Putative coat protein n=1 Tax=Ficedula parva Genomoviridae sp. TaxID=2814952 RepID=A0A8E7G1Z4_9VIRU|nr:MAG: capsid protein [Gemycircularvirus]UBQ66269.1 Cap protein [finch CRESS-DNA virus]
MPRYARRTRRSVARRKPSRRSSYRRSSVKKRTYRKKTSRKTILNISSRKKRNGMLSWSNTSSTGAFQTVAVGPAIINGTTGASFLWNATAQDLFNTNGRENTIAEVAARTSTTCYMRGLAETLRISTSTGLPWFHRRICFTAKSPFLPVPNPGATVVRPTFSETSNGIERLWFNASINNDTQDVNNTNSVVFKGAFNVDWNDPIVAPLDTSRITVKYDKTFTYRSGNQVGTVKTKKFWHGMNSNLRYDDDEQGDYESSSYYSVQSKEGMGNYFVYDVFSPLTGATSTDILRIDTNSTLYWHEK